MSVTVRKRTRFPNNVAVSLRETNAVRRVAHVALTLRVRKAERAGVTRTEVVVGVLVLAVLISLLVPAMLSSRESSRSTHCKQNIAQVCLALQTYHDTNLSYPAAAI